MSQIRTILCGASVRGESLTKSFHETGHFAIVAVVDPIIERADYINTNGGYGAKTFRHIQEALSAVPCDAVIVASSDAHHAEAVIPCLEAGKHVFCEKPIETTQEKCDAIRTADQAAGGKTFIGFNLRYAPVYEKARQLIAEGAIGQVLTIQADEFYDGGRTYFRRWNRLPECGGLWITKASHDFDLINMFAGDARALNIYAIGSRSYYAPKPEAAQYCRECSLREHCPDCFQENASPLAALTETVTGQRPDLCLYNSDGDTFDHGIATIRYENDICATYTCNVVSGFTDRRLRVSGTKGTIDGSLSSHEIILRRRDPATEERIPLTEGSGGHGGADGSLGGQFAAFVRGEVAPRVDIDTAIRSVQLGLAAQCSMKSGSPVNLSKR